MEANIRAFWLICAAKKDCRRIPSRPTGATWRKFGAFAEERKVKLESATHSDVVEFLRMLYLKKLDSRSVARHLVTVRHFSGFA